MKKFLSLYNSHFLVKLITVKERHIVKTYITTAIRNFIKHANKLQRLCARWPITYEKEFKQYRNMLTKIIRTAKENHYKDKKSRCR